MARPTSLKTVLSQFCTSSSQPVYLLDNTWTIVFANQALADWVQQPVEKLIGLRCEYGSTSLLANSLAPPAHVGEASFESLRGALEVAIDGGNSCRHATFCAIHLDNGEHRIPVLVVVDRMPATSVEDPLDADALHRELIRMRKAWHAQHSLDRLVGTSPAMERAREQVRIAVASGCRLTIMGPTGSGRESLARSIHQSRTHGHVALVPLSCDLLDAELLQTTFEAFRRQDDEVGDFEPRLLLLLDVDQLDMAAQVELLHRLSTPEVNLTTLATCRQSLTQLAQTGTFLPDLAQYLSSLEICLPRLVDRLSDLPLLAQDIVEWMNRETGGSLGGFARGATDVLLQHTWPGELRELRDVVREAHEVASKRNATLIGTEDLPRRLQFAADAVAVSPPEDDSVELDKFLLDVERELITRSLARAKGNKALAARSLHISRTRLLRRIEQWKIT